MRTPRLFVEQSLSLDAIVTIADAPFHYVRNVLRMREGDGISLFNGSGGEYKGIIASMKKSVVEVRLSDFNPIDRESPLCIKLGLAVIKRDAMDTAIQKATELGVSEITPIISEFVSVPHKSIGPRHDHWLQVVRSACEQCERNRLPILHPATDIATWITGVVADLKLVAHPGDASPLQTEAPGSVAVLIGPEGGLDEEEVSSARQHGFVTMSLGPRILRAETAPLAILAQLQARWGDLQTH